MARIRLPSSKAWVFSIVIAFVVASVAYYLTRPANTSGSPGGLDAIQRSEVGTVLAPDAIRAIDNPSFDSGSAASPNTRVLAVALGNESHAFPIATLSQHEIVNDRLGGKNIAITW